MAQWELQRAAVLRYVYSERGGLGGQRHDRGQAQCIVLDEKYSVPSRAKRSWPSRNVMGSNALPRCNCRKTLLNTGRSTLGETGSRMVRMCVSHGTRSMP